MSQQQSPNAIINSGNDLCSMGSHWIIIKQHKLRTVTVYGPEELDTEGKKKEKGTGITKAKLNNSLILICIKQGITIPLDNMPALKYLTDQCFSHGIKIHDVPHTYNGKHSIIIPTNGIHHHHPTPLH